MAAKEILFDTPAREKLLWRDTSRKVRSCSKSMVRLLLIRIVGRRGKYQLPPGGDSWAAIPAQRD